MSKIDEALHLATLDFEDEPTSDAFAILLRDAFNRAESFIHPMSDPLPWIPLPSEINKSDMEAAIAEFESVPLMINMTFTIAELSFEEKLASLDYQASFEPVSGFEVELDDLEWESSEFDALLEDLDYEHGRG